MITKSLYIKYLNQIDLVTGYNYDVCAKINQISISFYYNKLIKHIFFYYNKLFNENTIYMNIYLFFFIVFNHNINVVEKITKYKQKDLDASVSLKIFLENTHKSSTINKFLFEFLFCISFLKLRKKNKTQLTLKFPNIFNTTLKYLEIKKNDKLNIKFVYALELK